MYNCKNIWTITIKHKKTYQYILVLLQQHNWVLQHDWVQPTEARHSEPECSTHCRQQLQQHKNVLKPSIPHLMINKTTPTHTKYTLITFIYHHTRFNHKLTIKIKVSIKTIKWWNDIHFLQHRKREISTPYHMNIYMYKCAVSI